MLWLTTSKAKTPSLTRYASEELKLTADTYVIFDFTERKPDIVLRHIPSLSDVNEEDIYSHLSGLSDAKQVVDGTFPIKVRKDRREFHPEVIWWLNNPKYVNAEVPHIGWGNLATLDYEFVCSSRLMIMRPELVRSPLKRSQVQMPMLTYTKQLSYSIKSIILAQRIHKEIYTNKICYKLTYSSAHQETPH